jgi:biopolymer transport protein TolR
MGAKVGGRRGKRGGFSDINVTPLVDVMLVLVVVFMVTAPLLTTGLRIDLPEVQAADTPVKDSRLLVSITKEGQVMLGETDITGRVPQALRENARVQNEGELYIRADKDARYGVVAEVVAASRSNGVQSLNLLVQPELEPVEEETDPATGASKPTGTATPATKP